VVEGSACFQPQDGKIPGGQVVVGQGIAISGEPTHWVSTKELAALEDIHSACEDGIRVKGAHRSTKLGVSLHTFSRCNIFPL
jgi:hypothetical protein